MKTKTIFIFISLIITAQSCLVELIFDESLIKNIVQFDSHSRLAQFFNLNSHEIDLGNEILTHVSY